ncbi:MAG: hypothetical protein QMD43_02480 [Thermodesulfovibrio sp.]|uniref:SIMPL domain-containing protein n=1 Tax=Thermodesulfovibrio sp. N1 TaxID=1871110 RepID=UPI00083A6465|nr:SIMPL domain-containing protein [Thermodesulfovibrio sp. N1]MDI6713883.1 hypothetical protein [Thermodesulfovibrio sp.]ODA43259.1 hypothetical protein THER_2021 [Thermodesulfovibrio sp. N1]
MKKAILFVIIFIILFTGNNAFSEQKDSTKVYITLEEAKDLIPDIYTLSITVNVNSIQEAELIKILGNVDKSIKNLRLNYKGGKYNVYRNCWWEKGREVCSGYKGNVYYYFELEKPEQQNKILESLAEFKEKHGEKVSLTISNPMWTVSKRNLRIAEEELKLEIVDTAKAFTQKMSEKLGKICNISEINYDLRRPPIWYPFREEDIMLKSATKESRISLEAPTPVKEDKTLSVKTSITLICR